MELKPDWPKGYSRLGAAHLGLGEHEAAISAYKKGLEIDPNNEPLKSGLADAQSAASRSRPAPPPNPFGNVFSGPEMWAKLTADPTTRAFLQQPDFLHIMQEIQRNPNSINTYLKDQRVMQSLGVLLNLKMHNPAEEEPDVPAESSSPPAERKRAAEAEPVKEPEPEPMEVADEDKEAKEKKLQAQKEKEAGNAAYKKKDFEKAINHYSKALELDDEDISFLTNRAAVYLEMGKVFGFTNCLTLKIFLIFFHSYIMLGKLCKYLSIVCLFLRYSLEV